MRAARTAGRIASPERLTVKANGGQVRLRPAARNGNIVANMSADPARLGEVEQLVLLAVDRRAAGTILGRKV